MQPASKFHHPVFNRSEVIMLTNKPTNNVSPLKASTSLPNATPVGKNNVRICTQTFQSLHNIVVDAFAQVSVAVDN